MAVTENDTDDTDDTDVTEVTDDTDDTDGAVDGTRRGRRFGLSPLAVWGLAALGVPRVVAHDLSLVGPELNLVLVFAPPLAWLAVVCGRRVATPLPALSMVGLAYGVLLAVTHQVLWEQAFADGLPTLGGDLAGTLSPLWEDVLVRGFAVVSSVATGLGVGVATGVVAWVLVRVRQRLRGARDRSADG